jgi:hypothetical protein
MLKTRSKTMKAKSWIFCVLGVLMALSMLACDDDDSTSKIMLSELTANPMPVVINSANIGTITVDVSEANPSASATDALGTYLADQTIIVEVTNDTTGTSYTINQGILAQGAPTAAGQYAYEVDAGVATIYFYNEFAGSMLSETGNYSAMVTVLENSHFETESFQTSATVTMQ